MTFTRVTPIRRQSNDLDAYRRAWDDGRRRADSHLFWPWEPYRDDRSILVAGCGTVQAAHYAARWPRARVVGIDVSAASIAFSENLKERHRLTNLALRVLPVERAAELGERFDHIVCTGVLHHLEDPGAGLRALRDVLAPAGALHVMVYAPYGRAGVYMLQEYCRRLGLGYGEAQVRELTASLKALPADHPLSRLLKNSPDFASVAGVADALLHPRDRAYSVTELLTFLREEGLEFGRWIRQAPYLPRCGAPASAPLSKRVEALAVGEQYAELELFRGTMVRHVAAAYRVGTLDARRRVDFGGDAWLSYVPIRLHGTIAVRERLPAGASAVLINRNHTFTDLYLPIDARRERLYDAIDGARTIEAISGRGGERETARAFFEQLWEWDQVTFDTSGAGM